MGLNHHKFDDLLSAASQNGFKGIEVPAGAFETKKAAHEASKRMADLGMHFGLIMAPADMYRVNENAFKDALSTWNRWAELARVAGCTRAYNHIWPGNNERSYDENFEWHFRRLSDVYKMLNGHGIHYGLEFMGPKLVRDKFKFEFIHSLMGILTLTQAVDSRIGFVFDTFHWYCSGSNPEDLNYVIHHTGQIVNLHLADPNKCLSREMQLDDQRALPHEKGIIDVVEILKKLSDKGYNGPVIIEPMKPTTERYAAMPLQDASKDAIQCLHSLFSAAGLKDGE